MVVSAGDETRNLSYGWLAQAAMFPTGAATTPKKEHGPVGHGRKTEKLVRVFRLAEWRRLCARTQLVSPWFTPPDEAMDGLANRPQTNTRGN